MGCGTSKPQPYVAPPQEADDQVLYRPLNSARKEIRLLIVPYAEVGHEAPIRCSLVQTSLNEALKYEALSYVWLVARLLWIDIQCRVLLRLETYSIQGRCVR
jgi:hypothetical protein